MDDFIGAIKLFAGNFAPRGWEFCDGRLLSIAQNTALFSILGTTYGGNGTTTFALPDLRGRVPVGTGQGINQTDVQLGEMGGAQYVTLLSNEIPAQTVSINTGPGADPGESTYVLAPNNAYQPHLNMQPYLGISFIIATYGIYPPRQ